MENIGDLLSKRNIPQEPDEIRLVKDYVKSEFNTDVQVAVKDDTIVITVASSSLANMLRLRTMQLKEFFELSCTLREVFVHNSLHTDVASALTKFWSVVDHDTLFRQNTEAICHHAVKGGFGFGMTRVARC